MTNPCEYISDSFQSHRLSDDELRFNHASAGFPIELRGSLIAAQWLRLLKYNIGIVLFHLFVMFAYLFTIGIKSIYLLNKGENSV